MPEKEVSNYDEDGLADKYIELKDANPHFAADRRVLRSLLKDINELRGDKGPVTNLCDLACGNGYYARMFKRDAGGKDSTMSVVGIDLSQDMITSAEEIDAKEGLGLRFVQGDVNSDETVQKAGGPFDACDASYLFGYFTKRDDLVGVLKAVQKMLKPGGYFFGVTGNPDCNWAEPEAFLDQFGFWVEPTAGGKAPDDGSIIRVWLGMFNGKDKPEDRINLDVAYWTAPAYESAFEEAGIPIVKWQTLSKDPKEDGEEIKEGEGVYWSNHASIAFLAQRKD